MMRQAFFALLLQAVLFSMAPAFSPKTCEYASDHYLTREIGIQGSSIPHHFLFACDTMEVRKGDTTKVYSSEYLHFGEDASEKNVVMVHGTLIFEGSSKYPAHISGSLRQNKSGYQPGEANWGGIRVMSTGTLIMKHAHIVGAKVPIESQSTQVTLKEVEIADGEYLIKPDGSFLAIDKNGSRVVYLNLGIAGAPMEWASLPPSAKKGDAKNPRSPGRVSGGKNSQSIAPWIWGGLGAVVVGGGAAAWYVLSDKDKPGTTPESEGYPSRELLNFNGQDQLPR